MKIKQVEDWIVYTPRYADNEDSATPMTLEIKPMTAGDLKRHKLEHGPKMQGKNMIAEAEKSVTKVLTERVRNVQGFSVEILKDAKITELSITDGVGFAGAAPEELRSEVFGVILDINSLKQDLGKLSSVL